MKAQKRSQANATDECGYNKECQWCTPINLLFYNIPTYSNPILAWLISLAKNSQFQSWTILNEAKGYKLGHNAHIHTQVCTRTILS